VVALDGPRPAPEVNDGRHEGVRAGSAAACQLRAIHTGLGWFVAITTVTHVALTRARFSCRCESTNGEDRVLVDDGGLGICDGSSLVVAAQGSICEIHAMTWHMRYAVEEVTAEGGTGRQILI